MDYSVLFAFVFGVSPGDPATAVFFSRHRLRRTHDGSARRPVPVGKLYFGRVNQLCHDLVCGDSAKDSEEQESDERIQAQQGGRGFRSRRLACRSDRSRPLR